MLKQYETRSLNSNEVDTPLMGTQNLYLYIKQVRAKSKRYRYLVIEEYKGNGDRKTILSLPVDEAIKLILSCKQMKWCGGWDSNPRRPTPSGPQPDPFDLARAPPPKQETITPINKC